MRADDQGCSAEQPMSYAQRDFWLFEQIAPEARAFNEGYLWRIQGDLDTPRLRAALQTLIDRNDGLRLILYEQNGELVQAIRDRMEAPFETLDVSGWDDKSIYAALIERVRLRFDLSRGPLLRLHVLSRGRAEHFFLLASHHAALDGLSRKHVVELLVNTCASVASAEDLPTSQFSTFPDWQRSFLESRAGERQWSYWRETLSGEIPKLALPTDRVPSGARSFQGAFHWFGLGPEISTALNDLALRYKTTPFRALVAAYQVFLHRYSQQERFFVSFAVSGRPRQYRDTIGQFANPVLVRADLSSNSSFADVLARANATVVAAVLNGDFPQALLAERLRLRDRNHASCYDVMIEMISSGDKFIWNPSILNATPFAHEGGVLWPVGPSARWGPLLVEEWAIRCGGVNAQLALTFTECGHGEGLVGIFNYDADTFDRATIERMAENLRTLVASAVAQPDRSIGSLPLLSNAERRGVLVEWNATTRAVEEGPTVDAMFEAWVDRTPDAVAVEFEGRRVTYRELDERANRVAHWLGSRGLPREARVSVELTRSPDMLAAVLGIMKAGYAYVPIEPTYPIGRREYVRADAAVAVVFDDATLAEVLAAGGDARRPARERTTDDLAYVLYTSGSTGRPKGVMVPHGAVVNFLVSMRKEPGLAADDKMLGLTTLSFDIAGLELYLPLSVGATLVLASREDAMDGARLAKLIEESQPTVVQATPATWRMLLASGFQPTERLRVLCGGEAVPPDLADTLASTAGAVWNMYGPTETTIWSTCVQLRPGQSITIGRPIANTQVYVVDKSMAPVPVGVHGELCISGDGVSRGYWNRPELTAEKFVPDPFSARPGQRLYKTGDLARWLPTGEIEYLGRIDHQVKIRGFRIELGEIDAVLTAIAGVHAGVVLAREDVPGDKRLVAYVVAKRGATLDREALRNELGRLLPDYMVPSTFVVLDALPLTTSGKVDRKALPAPDFTSAAAEYTAPRSETERVLCEVFEQMLGVERVGIHDDFFALGGHSLLATRVVSRIRLLLQVDVPLRELFELTTVAKLAARVRSASTSTSAPPFVRIPRTGPLRASFAQERLWFLSRLDPSAATYNVSFTPRLRGRLDREALERSVREIVRRHEVLRTTLVEIDGALFQVVRDDVDVGLECVEAAGDTPEAREAWAAEYVERATRRPVDLENGPIVSAKLVRLADDEHMLVLVIHHIATDAWSLDILERELSEAYTAYRRGGALALPELPFQYADFSAWQREWFAGGALDGQLDYWKGHLAGAPTSLDLPTDRPRPAMKRYRGSILRIELPREQKAEVAAFARREGVTPFMVFLAAYNVLLARYSGQKDVVVGTPIANRTRAELEGIAGFFVNVLPMRTRLDGDPTFRDVVRRVKETSLGGYSHQDVPFERLVDQLRVPRDTSRTPVFQVAFINNIRKSTAFTLDGDASPPHAQLDVAKPDQAAADPDEVRTHLEFDLTLWMIERGDCLFASFEYDTDLFDRATIERMAEHFTVLLRGALAKPEERIASLPLMSDTERHRVLGEWNTTAHELGESRCVHEIFEAQASRTPDAVAVEFEGQRLSYADLDAKANRLAHALLRRGVEPGQVVAVCMERSLEMVVSLYAVLKAGGAYAPLDPTHPAQRLEFLARDLASPAVLVTSATAPRLAGVEAMLVVDTLDERDLPQTKPDVAADDRRLAYVIYTSGSTGTPKGVMNVHSGLRNRLLWMQAAYRLTAADVVLQKTPYTFDVSVWEFFWPLMFGARLVVARPEGHKDPAYLLELIRDRGVTTAHFVPSMLGVFLEQPELSSCTSLRRVICSGEALPRAMQDKLLVNLDCELHNLYGPTEASIDVSYWACTPDDAGREVPIGRPIWNTQLYVVDGLGNPCPIGVPGELCIGGVGLARGYWKRPELTAEKFVPDPFASQSGARLYRTGDLVRWLPGGELAYLGRLDHQVKLRGLRIELGEIEATVRSAAGVRDVVVVVREDVPGDKRLVAYLVAASGTAIDVDALREHLRRSLPDYMLPSAFVVLDEMPLTATGKVDRKALPAPDFTADVAEYVAPRDGVEATLAEIFRDVLHLERVGARDDYFALGGNSLQVMRVVTRVKERLGVNVPVRIVFEAPTVERLAARVEQLKGPATGPTLERVPNRQRAPLSYGQLFWWKRQEHWPDSPRYNFVYLYRIRGALDEAAFRRSVDEGVRRHDALRTTFVLVQSEPVQVVHSTYQGRLEVRDFRGAPPDAVDQFVLAQHNRHPNLLSETPLPTITLLRVADDEHVLVLAGHRGALDPALCHELVDDVEAIYRAFTKNEPSPLSEPQYQYVDFVAWQRKCVEMPEVRERIAAARRRLEGASPLALPFDRERGEVDTTKPHRTPVPLDPNLRRALGELARAESTTQFVVIAAAFKAFLSKVTGQTDITIIAPNEQWRGLDPALSTVFGVFNNYFLLRTDLSGRPTLRDVVRREHAVVHAAQRDADLPCMLLRDDYVDGQIWRVALNVIPNAGHDKAEAATSSGIVVKSFWAPFHRMVDLAWSMVGEDYSVLATGNDTFDPATNARLAAQLLTFLSRALEAPDVPLATLQ